VVRCWCGGVWIWRRRCVVDACVSGFLKILNSLTVFQIYWDLQDSFWVYIGVQICWDLQVFVYLVDFYRIDRCWLFGGGLPPETYMPDFSFYRCPINLTHGAAFWILIGRTLLIRVRGLVSSSVFMGRIDVFFGGLKADECLSKNEIRIRPLLGGYVMVFSLVFNLYTTHLLCSL
jgi:hypothetical protein